MIKKIINFFSGEKEAKARNADIKILVVEDNEVDLLLIKRILSKKGYNILSEVRGDDGLKTAIAEKPDLVILDCLLPGMSGQDVCRNLKEKDETTDIPILFLTVVDTPSNIVECFDMSAESYLVKPVRAKLLISEVEIILEDFHKKNATIQASSIQEPEVKTELE